MTELTVPIRSDLVTEIILRSRGEADVSLIVEDVVEAFLDRTRGDGIIWSKQHAEEVAQEGNDKTLARIGPPSKGYNWSGIFLPNGTMLRVEYKGEGHSAEVLHQQIIYEGECCSPSEFASRAANNTSRNAWRDIWIKKPRSSDWEFSGELRRGLRVG